MESLMINAPAVALATEPEAVATTAPAAVKPVLLVLSHVRWGFVYRRPQHLVSRLARHYDILYVEEPVFADAPAKLDGLQVAPGVEVLTPRTALESNGFSDEQLALLTPLLGDLLRARGIADYVMLFYSPMAAPMVDSFAPRAVVYDCTEDIADRPGRPVLLKQRERRLLAAADLVLTSGPALYERKRAAHRNVQCLPSAVDASHFSPSGLRLTAVSEAVSIPSFDARDAQNAIARPRLGFFGVIDERVDLSLIAALADADSHWQIMMVGPVLGIDHASLPRRSNIHWLGMQPYSVLPELVAGWDVCLLPFAVNEATRHMNPTKTLEYMAAEKPVVSSAIADVVSLYGDVVRVAGTRSGFVEQCREALGENTRRRASRVMEMTQCVARFSWDSAAETVHQLIEFERAKATVEPVRLVEQASVLDAEHVAIPAQDLVPATSPLAAHAARVAAMRRVTASGVDPLPQRAA
jgi:glycosyltransferase involved in cell wall biosynthesis